MATLEAQIQWLEDLQAIERLKLDYAQALDAGLSGARLFPTDALMSLFTDDAVWESNIHGRFEGYEALAELFTGWAERLSFARHFTIGPSVDIAASGAEGSGHWYSWETLTVEGRAIYLAATYDDDFRKVDGRWLIQHIRSNIIFRTPYESGWVKEPFPQS